MTAEACVSEMVITLQAAAPPAALSWGFLALDDTATQSVDGSLTKIKVRNKNGVKFKDITDILLKFTSAYFTSTHTVPGVILGVTLTVDSGVSNSKKLRQNNVGIVLKNASGTFEAAVTTPAQTPGPPPPVVVDPDVPKKGTWSITSSGQNPVKLLVSS